MPTLKQLVFLFFLACLFLGCEEQKPKEEVDLKRRVASTLGKKVDSLLTPYVEELRERSNNTAGLAIGITQGDTIIYARTFGYANIEQGVEADFNTLFHIASLSKPFTAAAVVKLVEQKKLRLSDPIKTYIPEFKMKGASVDEITIKQILTHTSGIPRHISSGDWENPTYGPNALAKNLINAQNFELDFKPGSQFNYSNSAYDILGIVVERASGMPFDEYIKKHLLKPSGMTSSEYLKPRDSLPRNWAAPYSYGLETQSWAPYPYSENYMPSSGLQTTLLDMCRWGMLYHNNGKFNNASVISEQQFSLLSTPHFDTPWGDKIGLSWFLQSYLERPIIMHTGSDTGFESLMYIYPEDDISIVVMANRDFARTGRIVNAASEIIFNEPLKPYTLSAKYAFSKAYKAHGIAKAKLLWNELKKDTTDIYYVDDDDILTTAAVLENGNHWKESKEILDFYLTINDRSTYAWRLLGNANLHLGDTASAKSCYQQTLMIDPNYEKGREALDELLLHAP